MDIIERPSPNFGPRRADSPIDILLLHYTGMSTADAAIDRLCDPIAEVSCHYVIDEDGTVFRLVDETRRAWHAGIACWAGERDINSRSVGIELVNPGHEFGYRAFPEAQMAALETLAIEILTRHPIPPWRVLAHSDVAPTRKRDPGELFDWPRLACSGIGLWPEPLAGGDAPALPDELEAMLHRFGYGVEAPGDEKAALADVLIAFQRHFRPKKLSGEADSETLCRLRSLLRQSGL